MVARPFVARALSLLSAFGVASCGSDDSAPGDPGPGETADAGPAGDANVGDAGTEAACAADDFGAPGALDVLAAVQRNQPGSEGARQLYRLIGELPTGGV